MEDVAVASEKRWEGAGPFCGAAGGGRSIGASDASESEESLSSVITGKAADGTNGGAEARKRWPERVTPRAGSWTSTPGTVICSPLVYKAEGRGRVGRVRGSDEEAGGSWPNGV